MFPGEQGRINDTTKCPSTVVLVRAFRLQPSLIGRGPSVRPECNDMYKHERRWISLFIIRRSLSLAHCCKAINLGLLRMAGWGTWLFDEVFCCWVAVGNGEGRETQTRGGKQVTRETHANTWVRGDGAGSQPPRCGQGRIGWEGVRRTSSLQSDV